MGMEGIGARVARKEDKRFITGAGRYTDDMVVPGMKHAIFVRSPHAHATIKKINVKTAEKMPGVIAVLTGPQLKGDGIGNLICGWMIHSKDGSPMKMGAWSPIATDTVRYVGDAVAVVIAETRNQAKDAAEAVEVSYKELPAVIHAVDALKPGAPQLHPEAPGNLIYDWEIGSKLGDVEAAIKGAAHVTRMKIRNNRLVPNAMEPRAALGVYDKAEDHFTLWTTSQNPHVARLVLSAFYNVAPENKLRVIAPDVGGGFGSKIYIYPEEIVCLWASKRTGVPVKWVADRTESFLTDAHGRDHETEVEMAFDKNNKIVGLKVDTVANLGAYMSLFSSSVPTYLYATLLSGQYDIPLIHANVRTVYTNTAPVDAYRGAGRPEATYLLERTMETDTGDYEASISAAMKDADWDGFPARKAEAASRGKLRGIGMSC
ncbi:MAG: xanthine dehydrogenase family protein molybdopterin-binding subunit, partial [Rhizobiaceae bacterium]|nr:xanthine dehydrogenase family protein molybdopterin-binding subunit [Rhizobiaceae bacterium]